MAKKIVKKAVAKKAVAKGKSVKKVVSAKKPLPKKKVKVVAKAKAKVVKPVKKVAPPKPAPKPLFVIPKKPVLLIPKNDLNKQYTQGELFDAIKEFCGFRGKKEAKEFFLGFAGMIQEALKAGYKIMLPGLGKIQVRCTNPRIGRNPMTGEEIKIPAKKRIRFTAIKVLKDAVL